GVDYRTGTVGANTKDRQASVQCAGLGYATFPPDSGRSRRRFSAPRPGGRTRPAKMSEEPKLPRHRGFRLLVLAALLGALAPATAAIDPDDLLPVDEAFALQAQADSPDAIAIDWRIADGYYLYRHRTSVQADAGFAAQALQMPPGEAHEDEFFGAVETYRDRLRATLPGQARAASTVLTIKYQGCADAGICYPPQTRKVTVALPAGTTNNAGTAPLVAFGNQAAAGTANPLAGGLNPLLGGTATGTDALPLPPEQAFGFEAIAGDGNTLLLRFTPARGYYLYRDNTSLELAGNAAGITLGAPQWPRGTEHRDEHFGDVVVYFRQIDVPLPLRRARPEPATIQLTATFQGCQTGGICSPPMTRTIEVALPAGAVAAGSAAPPASADRDAASGNKPDSVEQPVATASSRSDVSRDLTANPDGEAFATDVAPTRAGARDVGGAQTAGLAEDSRLAAALSGP